MVPKENPEELAKAILSLVEDKEKSQAMGLAGIDHVKANYNWVDNANGMLELYDQTLKKGMKS